MHSLVIARLTQELKTARQALQAVPHYKHVRPVLYRYEAEISPTPSSEEETEKMVEIAEVADVTDLTARLELTT